MSQKKVCLWGWHCLYSVAFVDKNEVPSYALNLQSPWVHSVFLLPAILKIAGLSCDETRVLLCSGEALANDPVGFADRACENLFEPVEMLTVHPSYHGFSVNHQAFHTACYQMRADVARWTGTEHKQGVGIL